MRRHWLGAVLVTVGLAGRAPAQTPPGVPPGAGGSPPMYQPQFAGEPVPMGGPQFCPQPPGGPDPGAPPFSLPNDGSPNAWDCPPPPGCGGPCWYVSVGWMALMRQSFGGGLLAIRDPGFTLGGSSTNIDTGNLPPPGSPPILGLQDLTPQLMSGVRAFATYREGPNAFEIGGWYLFESSTSAAAALQGRLDQPFAFLPSPLGFQGDNGMWLQADRVIATYTTALGSAEANYRHAMYPGFEWIFGVRYLDLRQSFTVLTDDDGLTVSPINPTQIATVGARTHNHIVAPQLGFEFEYPLVSCLTAGFTAKGAWGANFLQQENFLVRGDGFLGPSQRQTSTIFSHLYELALWGTWQLNDQIRLKGGYMALWVVHVPDAAQQIGPDLANPTLGRNTGSIFFHGPMAEIQIAF